MFMTILTKSSLSPTSKKSHQSVGAFNKRSEKKPHFIF